MRSFKLFFFVTVFLIFVSCSKKDETVGGVSATDNQTIAYIPASSIGFMTWDTQSASYKKLKASPLGQQMSQSHELVKQAREGADPEAEKLFKIYDGLIETGLWIKSPDQPEVLASGVAFLDIDKETKLPQAAFYASGTQGHNLSEKVAKIKSIIDAQGIKTQAEDVGGNKGFSIAIEEAEQIGFPINKIIIAASADKLSITTNQALAAKYFSDQPENGIQKIKESAEYKRAASGAISSQESMSFAFFDVNKLIAGLEELAASTGVDAGASDLKEFPVEAVALSSSMDDSLSSTFNVALSPRNEMQKKIIASFSPSGENASVSKVPSDMMVLISIDGGTIKSIKTAALDQAPPGIEEMAGPILGLIDSIKSLSIGVRGASGATPFPELLILAQSSKAGEIATNVKSQLEEAMASSGMPIPFQEKEIAQAKVSYAVSPFGIGAYLTSLNDMVILTSAEKLVGDMIASSKSNDKSLLASLPKTSKNLAKDSKSLLVAYTDFTKLADAIGATQDSLAMFTGGAGGIPAEQIESIKQMGSVFLSLNMENNLVSIQSSYQPAG